MPQTFVFTALTCLASAYTEEHVESDVTRLQSFSNKLIDKVVERALTPLSHSHLDKTLLMKDAPCARPGHCCILRRCQIAKPHSIPAFNVDRQPCGYLNDVRFSRSVQQRTTAQAAERQVQAAAQDESSAATQGVIPNLWSSINAITFATTDMAASFDFYSALGLRCSFGGREASFTTMDSGDPSANTYHVNLEVKGRFTPARALGPRGWGRVVFYVKNVDQLHNVAVSQGLQPEFAPRDAPWGERYFHILDPMGHELSFAQPLSDHPRWKGSESPTTSSTRRESEPRWKGSESPTTSSTSTKNTPWPVVRSALERRSQNTGNDKDKDMR
eukprot:gnl/MRDRNA2_/MRDRNA2_237019_c0_seq1.p1 gnl/MRDRNA2_/MRDRNA2_237019_c0~~gnl/MRDRNA2_/MRDRNA2_237019_c0_seq1.p1  ORF type:complete len:330 (+),score=38.64 gnl/MRDRNA2_/MRDRNA2_237019_c0_seq1:129-1118(+)